MKYFFFILSMLAVVAGFFIIVDAKSAMQDIEAVLFFLIATVFMVGAGVIDAIRK